MNIEISSSEDLQTIKNQIEINSIQSKKNLFYSKIYLVLFILMIVLLLLIASTHTYDSPSFLEIIFPFLLGLIFFLSFNSLQKKSDLLLHQNKLLKVAIKNYESEQQQIETEQKSIIFNKQIKIKGTSYKKDEVNQVMKNIIGEYGLPYYNGFSNKEIEEYGGTYKYSGFFTNNVSLIKEPENKYDEFAILVLVYNIPVGYIPKEMNQRIYEYIDNGEYNLTKQISVLGGPYKEFDFVEDKVITDKSSPLGFSLKLVIKIIDKKEN